jgi:hypothetical protein
MFKQQESIGTALSFDAKQAWARRGDSGHERKEEKPAHVF